MAHSVVRGCGGTVKEDKTLL